jgi:hypothetical protein
MIQFEIVPEPLDFVLKFDVHVIFYFSLMALRSLMNESKCPRRY